MTRTIRTPAIAALLGLTMLGGCAEMTTVYRVKPVTKEMPTVVTVDAKQRHLLMVPEMTPATTRTITNEAKTWTEETRTDSAAGMRICAEAAPDVFTAMAASGTLDLSAGAKSKSGGADIGIGYAISETAAAIRRTQTVNLARESFYRTCERYMSGAISKTAFGVQAARDFRQAIAMLAIEQLTGVVEGPTTIIGGGSTSAAQTNPEEYYRQLQASADVVRQAKAELATAQEAAKDDKAPCKAVEGEEPDAARARKESCDAKKDAVTDAQSNLKAAEQQRADLLDMSRNGPPQGGIIAKTGAVTNVGGHGNQLTSDDVAQVANAVKEIALKAMNTDETLMFCLQALSGNDSKLEMNASKKLVEAGDKSVQETCLVYMAADVKAETSKKFLEAERNTAVFSGVKSKLVKIISNLSVADYKILRNKIRDKIDVNFCRLPGKAEYTPSQCAARLAAGDELEGTNWPELPTKFLALGISLEI
jgi:hypothetical protein